MNRHDPLNDRTASGPLPSIKPPALREPIFNLPGIVIGAILVLVAIHALRLLVSDVDDFALTLEWALVPARWTVALGAATQGEVIGRIAEAGGPGQVVLTAIAEFVLAEGAAKPWTGLTYAFLHGSWTHLLFNVVWLAAFGTPLARRLASLRFIALACAGALGGAVVQVCLHPFQVVPLIGASAAVSAMMGAAAWFMFAPPSWTLSGRPAQLYERPRESLAAMLRNRRVLIFIAIWAVTNYVFAVLAGPLGLADDSIAWESHLGGFAAGLALFPLLDRTTRQPDAPR